MRYDDVEEMVCLIAALDREELSRQLLTFTAHFSIDFTPEFLDKQTVDRLRHLLFALCRQCRRLPQGSAVPVAA